MKIKKLFLRTSFLQTLKEFYSSILELAVEETNENEIKIKTGNSELVFTETTIKKPFYHFAFNIPSNKIEEARTWLQERIKLIWLEDYKSEVANFVNWHAKSVYFFDPAGNILELIARFDLNSPTEENFSSRHFLSISEAGLIFKQDEFEQKALEILSSYSLTYFTKQPPMAHFAAIGDDEGLFIAVPEHRNWYPTNKASGIFPLSIEFENGGQNYNLKLM